MDFRLADIQKFAMIDPTKVLLELPAPEAEKEDILYKENPTVDVIDTATGEILPAEAIQSQSAPPPNYEFLKTMSALKLIVGDEPYYKVLKAFGYAHSNEITDRAKQRQVWRDMKVLADAVTQAKASAEGAP